MNTIFALSTPPGKSGVAIIRLSGEKVSQILNMLGCVILPKARFAKNIKLLHPLTSELLDEALLLWFPAPKSFTGEDVAELHLHGSRAVIDAVTSALIDTKQCRVAEPGEFAKRSFLNGKMDLTQAEGIADLIDAETKMQHKQAIRQMQGKLKYIYNDWRQQLINILAYIEAFIDFPDDDLPEDLVKDINDKVDNLLRNVTTSLNDNKIGEKVREGLHITIIGQPNSGKSSLINALARREVAIVSNIAGTTRDIIEVHLDIDGYSVIISDTAGLRDSNDIIENLGINKAREKAKHADLKILMFDAEKLPHLDKYTLDLIDGNAILVLNKLDVLQNDIADQYDVIAGKMVIKMSIVNNQGIKELLDKIKDFCYQNFSAESNIIITRARHRQNLEIALSHLKDFNLDKDMELAAEDLRLAANYLGQITGKIDIEEILDEIFANFCIGK